MNTQFRIKSLSFAVKSILIYGGITHVAWALDQENILNTSELPTITVTAIANDKTEGSGSYKANKSKSTIVKYDKTVKYYFVPLAPANQEVELIVGKKSYEIPPQK